MGTEIKPTMEDLERFFCRLAESQAKTQSQVDAMSETLSTLIKLNQNAERDDMRNIYNSLEKGNNSDPYATDIMISRDLSREEELENPDCNP
ncbi:hypothetical protein MKW92_028240, partial [Papaver armeniacum]